MSKNEKPLRNKFAAILLIFPVILLAFSPCVSHAAGKQKTQDLNITALQQAADNGDDRAQYGLGSLYCLGVESRNAGASLPKDTGKCVDLLTRSAMQGNTDAQMTLGSIYSSGTGVAKDYPQAYYWLSIAALSDPKAGQARDLVEAKLPPQIMLNVQQQVKNWVTPPKPLRY